MSTNKPIYGVTKNDIPFVRIGNGAKTLLVWSGGPGNNIPKGFALKRALKGLQPFLDDYSLTILTRRSGLTPGYTTRQMSDDFAETIHAEFDGHVDLIVGASYGGVIAHHFAADHPNLCDHIVMLMAAHKVEPSGLQIDLRFAELLSQNKPRQAYAFIAGVLVTNPIGLVLMRSLLWLLGPSMLGDANTATFRRDVLIEAQAEVSHDAVESLKRISTPTLVLGGAQDKYFPQQYYEETAALIPSAVLKIYPDKGHNLLDDEQAANDILSWVAGEL